MTDHSDLYFELLEKYPELKAKHMWRRAVALHKATDPFFNEPPVWLMALFRREQLWWQANDVFYYTKPCWQGLMRQSIEKL